MKYNMAITMFLSITLGFVLYANDAGLMVAIIWGLMIPFQAATWYMVGSGETRRRIDKKIKVIEQRMGVWN